MPGAKLPIHKQLSIGRHQFLAGDILGELIYFSGLLPFAVLPREISLHNKKLTDDGITFHVSVYLVQ